MSVYMKLKALGQRPEGCTAGTTTLATYLGMSKSSVERGLTQLRRPATDGVIELQESTRRSLPGGTGTTARRRVRPMNPTERFVWLPVAACEDLTPRQLRAYAALMYAQAQRIAVTLAEIAGVLRHHSGNRAGQTVTAAAAAVVIDGLETAGWVSVQRREGAQGRNHYIAHDLPPTSASHRSGTPVHTTGEWAGVPNTSSDAPPTPVVGGGSGASVHDGSLVSKEDLKIARPDDERRLSSPAVGEVPVVTVENPAAADARTSTAGDLALRADEEDNPTPSKPSDRKHSNRRRSVHSSYTGPQLSMTPQIYAVLEPVHWLLERVNNPFVERQIAREVGRQLKAGMTPERLHHRLTARFAQVMPSEIRDTGRWLLGVALPRWGCGHQDCESGTMWSTGRRCDVCLEVVQDRFAARQRAHRLEQGLCPDHGIRPNPNGVCTACQPENPIHHPALAWEARELEGPPRTSCGRCGARILLTGQALTDGLCKLCRAETPAPTAPEPLSTDAPTALRSCSGQDGDMPCGRPALPTRYVCVRHRAQELTRESA
ncbi:hypothetical protein [Streptomyces violascens]|uniref:hypothetical protein n=1 Tax=Streptomyces violascens TaxID=67381 RepID=UPI0036636D6E